MPSQQGQNGGPVMGEHAEYRVVQGRPADVQTKLNELARDGWRPILFSTGVNEVGFSLYLILTRGGRES